VGTYKLNLNDQTKNEEAPIGFPTIIHFASALDSNTVSSSISVLDSDNQAVELMFFYLNNQKTLSIQFQQDLEEDTFYKLIISKNLKGINQETFPGYEIGFTTVLHPLTITGLEIDGQDAINTNTRIKNVSLSMTAEIQFSATLDATTITNQNIRIVSAEGQAANLTLSLQEDKKTILLTANQPIVHLSKHTLYISDGIKGERGESLISKNRSFYTTLDPTPKKPVITDEALLTLVQQQSFKYFWDFAHPGSGLARERNSSGDIVTIGGSGFGIMSILVGIERNFITKQEGIERLQKIVDFLETADRFHGVWPHWMNGNTGKVIPFSANDNGGDLVETSFMAQGLMTVRQYLDNNITEESALIADINGLLNTIEWDWYTRGGQDVLYWHWSPNLDWVMNMQTRGHNETLITYVMASTSATHGIDYDVYNNGYARNGGIQNGNTFYNITLPLGEDRGGPLFFTHYSYLGLDPRNLQDQYANYWTQNQNHTLINRAYCMANPRNYVGYSADNWGLTASDNHNGYSAHSPNNDLGVITPTAALSSFPYTPDESMAALKFFYYTMGDRLWGDYGFYDAFNITEGWVADSYLAIDQGPIIVMIENHRSGLLWDLFMSAPEVQSGLTELGFTY